MNSTRRSSTTRRRSDSIPSSPWRTTTAASPDTKGEYDKAIADHDKAIGLDPKYARAYDGRGNVWYAKREYDKAIADYDEAIRLDPKYAMAYDNRGDASRAKQEYDKAIADYNKAIEIDPKFSFCKFGGGSRAARAVKFPPANRS